MDMRCLTKLLSATAAGSLLLLLTSSSFAGRMFPNEPQRPHIHAGMQPNWGFNPTCWQRFPPVAPCDGGPGCSLDGNAMVPSHSSSADIYTPQPATVLPQPSYYAAPSQESVQNYDSYGSPGLTIPEDSFNHSMSAPQNSVYPTPPPIPFGSPDSGHSQSHSTSPSTYGSPPVYAAPQHSVPQHSLPQPSAPAGSPPVQIFRAAPQSTPPLPPLPAPPLPAPPTPVPPIPGQTKRVPDRLQIGANGRVAAVPVGGQAGSSQQASSRYGVRAAGPAPQPSIYSDSSPRTSVPVQFATAPKTQPPTSDSRYGIPASNAMQSSPPTTPSEFQPQATFPVRSISRSRTIGATSASSRYGVTRPANSQPVENSSNLEPLRTTPRVPYQR